MADGLDTAAQGAPAVSDVLASAIPGILSRARIVISPYPFGVSDADNLRVVSVNAAPGVTIEIHGRQAQAGLDSKPFRFVHTPNTNRTAKTEDFTLGGGLVTNLSIFATAGSPLIGQCFVIVQLVRSLGVTAYVMGTLLQGYVTTTQNVGWPGSAIVSSTDGEPVVRFITGTAPGAANTPITETVPTGARWELIAFAATLTTPDTAAAIQPSLNVTFGGVTFLNAPQQVMAAGAYNNPLCCWSAGYSPNSTTKVNEPSASLPSGLKLLAGAVINVPGLLFETWNAPHYIVREWQEAV